MKFAQQLIHTLVIWLSTMYIDRYMVNLFFEIKRNSPSKHRASLKISDPDLGQTMIDLYHSLGDDANQRLIEVFLERAGDGWVAKLRDSDQELSSKPTIQNPRTAAVSEATQPSTDHRPTKARYYRGVLIEG